MKLLVSGFVCLCVCVAWSQNDSARFYNGDLFHEIPVRGSKYDLFVDFCAFTQALGRPCESTENGFIVTINNRTLTLNVQKKSAQFNHQTHQVRMMLVNGTHYISVRSLIQILQPLLSRQLIYEPTSRVIHLAKEKTLSVSMASGMDKQSYFLQIRYDAHGKKPTFQKSGKYLVMSFKSAYLHLDTSNLEVSEAIQNVNLFDHLPDKTSEIHLELGRKVAQYKVEPFTTDSGYIIIRFYGDFKNSHTPEMFDQRDHVGGIHRILIDPGHGGKDEGARGPSGLKEKNVNLLLSRALKRALDREGYEVLLTRDRDYHLPLKVRTGIANNDKADLLISIHMNAIKAPNAWGSETYYLSPDDSFVDEVNYTVQFENQDVHSEQEEGQDPTEVDLEMILWDLAQTEFLDDSFRVAKYVQEELNILAGTKNRGVKQAPLKVLQGARMPACLIEVAFISNPSEEEKLRNPAFKSRIIQAITTAVLRYDRDVIRRSKGKEDQP